MNKDVQEVNSHIYFHGTYLKDALLIKKRGFSLRKRRARGDILGPGFYMSGNKNWALGYAKDILEEGNPAAVLHLKVNVKSFFPIVEPERWSEEELRLYGKKLGHPFDLMRLGKIAQKLGYEAAGRADSTIVVYNPGDVKVVRVEEIF